MKETKIEKLENEVATLKKEVVELKIQLEFALQEQEKLVLQETGFDDFSYIEEDFTPPDKTKTYLN